MNSSDWTTQIPDDQWSVYDRALRALTNQNVEFALAGAFALAHYTGSWRNTKDLDLYIVPQDASKAMYALHVAGLADYYQVLPYDREWIHRSHDGEIIVDVIWAMPNQVSRVTEAWVTRGPQRELRGWKLRVAPIEELIWAKLFVLQRERCDWPDILRLLFHHGTSIDWPYLKSLTGRHWQMLAGALLVFRWLAPEQAKSLGSEVWEWVCVNSEQAANTGTALENARLLDSRPWFF